MITGMFTGATGMEAQQRKLDTISNNLANVDTTGYKQSRNEFADLYYVYTRDLGGPDMENPRGDTGVYTGLGVKEAQTKRIFTQGDMEITNRPLDVAIEGQGFFEVTLDDGTLAYTRDGSFDFSNNQLYINNQPITGGAVAPSTTTYDLTIQSNGTVIDSNTGQQVGAIEVFNFVNPEGLKSIGDNFYLETAASGEKENVVLGSARAGTKLGAGILEKSNVKAVKEMVNMISAQRAYEFNSKSITTADNMLQTVNALKR